MSGRMIIGTRGSALALWQANTVADALRTAHPSLDVEVKVIVTTGDAVQNVPLAQMGGKGLFTVELERALAEGEVDVCVHSMKDVQTVLPDGLCIAGMLPRADVRDVLVSKRDCRFDDLPSGAQVGTGSLRRRAQLKRMRPDLEYVELRGNLDTRIHKVTDGPLDACVLAGAGIDRMGWSDVIVERFETDRIVPAVGQGAIGIEARAEDERVLALVEAISDKATMRCVIAERLVMSALEGGCQAPLGAHALLDDEGTLHLTALVASLDGSQVVRRTIDADTGREDAETAATLVSLMRAEGADAILQEARAATEAAARERILKGAASHEEKRQTGRGAE